MKRFVLLLFTISCLIISPSHSNAITTPCSLVLNPIDTELKNAQGVALIYKVQLNPQSFERTNISILGVHLPEPSSYGNYDSYEGFAFKPEVISWRFKLYPSPELDSPTWAGRFDDITAELENAEVQIRLSNTKSGELGPPILENSVKNCK